MNARAQSKKKNRKKEAEVGDAVQAAASEEV